MISRTALAAMLQLLAVAASAATLYVDPLIAPAGCATYDPASRSCGPGADRAFGSLVELSDPASTEPGDLVILRDGSYSDALVPGTSGTPADPITYRNWPGETPTISGSLDPAIYLLDRSHLVLDGLRVDGVTAWLRAEDSSHNTIVNCSFLRATAGGSRGGVKFVRSDYNRFLDNTLDDGNDNLQFIHSDYNLAEGNTLTLARHNLWAILCGNFNVIRNNSFHNSIQKIGQITDCEGVPPDATPAFDATHHNLVEGNTFSYTPSSGDSSPYAGIQYAAQDGIVRRNVFHHTVGPGLDLTLYPDEALHNTDNRVYHNVFHRSDFAGLSLAAGGAGSFFSGNAFKNNTLSASVFVANDTRWSWYTNVLDGQPVQLLTGRLEGFLFQRNNILGSLPAQLHAITHGVCTSTTNPPPMTLGEWEASEPTLFADNLDVDPMFVDEASGDYHLAPSSPLIDAGGFLTSAVADGSGTSLPVADALYFFDGFGIPGEQGDRIRLEGSTEAAQILGVDYAANLLTVDRPLVWSAGEGVTLDYSGVAPDIGAYETPSCDPLPESVRQLHAFKAPPELTLEWAVAGGLSTASYNVWKVVSQDKQEIPLADRAHVGTSIVAVGSCTGVPRETPACVDPVALREPPAIIFYQVRGACADGMEGPL